jgi:hypothetical protein
MDVTYKFGETEMATDRMVSAEITVDDNNNLVALDDDGKHVEYAYEALYIVNGKDLCRLLHTANNPVVTIQFAVANGEYVEGLGEPAGFFSNGDGEKCVVVDAKVIRACGNQPAKR